MTAPNFNFNFNFNFIILILILILTYFIIIKTTTQGCQCPQHSGQHSGPRGGMLVVLSQHTHPQAAVLASWLGTTTLSLSAALLLLDTGSRVGFLVCVRTVLSAV
jgi:hypothetical protein